MSRREKQIYQNALFITIIGMGVVWVAGIWLARFLFGTSLFTIACGIALYFPIIGYAERRVLPKIEQIIGRYTP